MRVRLPTGGAVLVSDEIPDAVASAASCVMQTIVHAYERAGDDVDEATVVVIQGAGPLGLFSVALCHGGSQGHRRGRACPTPRSGVQLGCGGCAEHRRGTRDIRRVRWVKNLTGGRCGDIVVEVSGVPAAFGEGVDMEAAGGRYVIVGQGHNVEVKFNPSVLAVKHISIIGVRTAAPHHTWRAMQFLQRHRVSFDWEEMITSVQGLDDINVAFQRMSTWQEIKPAIRLLERS